MQGGDRLVAGPVVIGNPPLDRLPLLGGAHQEGGRNSNYQSKVAQGFL